MAPATTSALRIGPTDGNASAALLKTALLSHFETQDEPSTLSVSNRYFSAKVRLEPLNGSKNNDEKEDGIILVFDSMRSNPDIVAGTADSSSFDALTAVHEQAEQAHECGELLRLCAGVSVGEKTPTELRGQAHEEEYSRRVLWCLDRGYEYVEADLSAEGQTQGHEERDKEGFARIVEAISGTVWSSAVMEKKKQQELKQSFQEEKEKLVGDNDKTSNQKEEENAYVPPDPSLLDSEIQASLVKDAEQKEGDDYFVNDTTTTEQDKAMESLEGLLREATRIREASRAGELSDDERRKRASDAATLMMSLMNQLDDEEEQENDFEVDSSSDEEETAASS